MLFRSRDPGFFLFEARDSGFREKRVGIESMLERGMPKITLGITGLHEILARDYGIEDPYWGPSLLTFLASHIESAIIIRKQRALNLMLYFQL